MGAPQVQAVRQPKRHFPAEELGALGMYTWAVSLLEGIAADAARQGLAWRLVDRRPGDVDYAGNGYQARIEAVIPRTEEARMFQTLHDFEKLEPTLRQDGVYPVVSAQLEYDRWVVTLAVVSQYQRPTALAVVR